jgi:hypothetical protein
MSRSIFDDVQVIEPPQQGRGQGGQPRANLDHRLVTLHRQLVDDLGDDLLIDQEILAKALARDMRPHALTCLLPPGRASGATGAALATISMACSMATSKLPGSARPLPASSSAVPWSTEVRMIGRPSVTLMPWPKLAYLSAVRP